MPGFHFCPHIALVGPQIGCRPGALSYFSTIFVVQPIATRISHIFLSYLFIFLSYSQPYLLCNPLKCRLFAIFHTSQFCISPGTQFKFIFLSQRLELKVWGQELVFSVWGEGRGMGVVTKPFFLNWPPLLCLWVELFRILTLNWDLNWMHLFDRV